MQKLKSIGAFDAESNQHRVEAVNNYFSWNDRHHGGDLFICGASPQLNELNAAQIETLMSRVVIGANRTYYKIPISYFLSAYPPELLMAQMNGVASERIIHMRLPGQELFSKDFNSLNRQRFSKHIGLPRYFSAPIPTLYTSRNVVLAMTHMALVMGVKRIFYIGLDQRNYSYYYDFDAEINDRIHQDLYRVMRQSNEKYFMSTDREHYFSIQFDTLARAEERANSPFYEDFTERFSTYFDILKHHKVEVFSTLEGNVIHKAGAKLISLNDAIDMST